MTAMCTQKHALAAPMCLNKHKEDGAPADENNKLPAGHKHTVVPQKEAVSAKQTEDYKGKGWEKDAWEGKKVRRRGRGR